MSSVSGLDYNSALNDVVFVLPFSSKHLEDSLSNFKVIFLEDLIDPSIITTGGPLNTMKQDTIKELISKNEILSLLFGNIFEKLENGSEALKRAKTKIEKLLEEPVAQDSNEVKVEEEGRTAFFRYSRAGDPKNEWRPKSTGGLCFYIDLKPQEKKIEFSVSVCHPKDRFDRETARKIATHRMTGGQFYTLENYDLEMPVLWNIKRAAENYLKKPEQRDMLLPMLTKVPDYLNKKGSMEVRYIYQRT